MISEEAIEAYNSRLTVDVSSVDKLTPSQRDAVKTYGSQAEALLKSRPGSVHTSLQVHAG